jgi:hypothetical protein
LNAADGVEVAGGVAQLGAEGGARLGSQHSPLGVLEIEDLDLPVGVGEDGEHARPPRGSGAAAPVAQALLVAQRFVGQRAAHQREAIGVILNTSVG